MRRVSLVLFAAMACTKPEPTNISTPAEQRVDVIAHRGASGYRPEHTRAAYLLAIEQGADFIEPDLVATKDGVLVVRHENEISGTTDVASRQQFASRKTTKQIDGESITGWFTEDFTLAELGTLRARERLAELRPTSAAFDGQLEIMTFDQVIELARAESARTGRVIGICPETKHPSYFRSIGLPLEPSLVASLEKVGWNRRDAPVCIQSFEVANLEALDKMTEVPLAQLIWIEGGPFGSDLKYAEMVTASGLEAIAAYADIVAPEKRFIIGRDAAGGLKNQPTDLVEDAHRVGLRVVPYTFRKEAPFLPADHQGDLVGEIERFLDAGVDGLFTDFPDIAVAARASFLSRRPR